MNHLNPNSISQRFDGATFDPERDGQRLTTLLDDVRNLMSDGLWRSLGHIRDTLQRGSEASISARLRDLRKERFGGFNVDHKNLGGGLWIYRVWK